MPQENVKEIALVEITEEFKTKLASVTPSACSPLPGRCLATSAPFAPRMPLLCPPEETGLKNNPWKAFQ